MSISEVIDEGPPRFVAAADCGDDGDAGEDALSLCDLPMYGDAADYSFSSENASSSGDEFFEFSPREHHDDFNHPGPSPVWDSRDILFCGKLIPSLPTSHSSIGDRRTDQATKRNKRGVAKKARAITYSSARCDKWYMLAFGLARFPSEMALSEIRRRQGKGNPLVANSFQFDSGEIVISERTRVKKGGSVWGMLKLKDLGSSRRDADAVVKTSFGCFF